MRRRCFVHGGSRSPPSDSPCCGPSRGSRTSPPTPSPTRCATRDRRHFPAVGLRRARRAGHRRADPTHPAGRLAARFETRVGDNHHHLICRVCGRVVDVDCAIGAAPCLHAADDRGYEIDEAEVAYWGRCPECQAASRTAPPSAPSPRRRAYAADRPRIPRPDPSGCKPHHLRGQSRYGQRNEVSVLQQGAHRPWQPRLVAGSVEPERAAHESSGGRPDGRRVRLRQGVPVAGSRRRQEGHRGGDDRFAGLVAGRLRPLRRPVHPHGLAQRRAPTASTTAAAAPGQARSASRRSAAGRTTPTSTRRAGCCGR